MTAQEPWGNGVIWNEADNLHSNVQQHPEWQGTGWFFSAGQMADTYVLPLIRHNTRERQKQKRSITGGTQACGELLCNPSTRNIIL